MPSAYENNEPAVNDHPATATGTARNGISNELDRRTNNVCCVSEHNRCYTHVHHTPEVKDKLKRVRRHHLSAIVSNNDPRRRSQHIFKSTARARTTLDEARGSINKSSRSSSTSTQCPVKISNTANQK